MAQDIIDFVIEKIKTMMPGTPEKVLTEIEDKTRTVYGGDEVYVSKKKIKESQKEKAVTEYLGGKPLKKIKDETGVGRATLYRHLKK